MKTDNEYIIESSKIKTLLLEFICAVDANSRAHDDDLELTWEELQSQYAIIKLELYNYLEKLT